MKVEVKTPFGKISFEMTPSHATALLQQAIEYATGGTAPLMKSETTATAGKEPENTAARKMPEIPPMPNPTHNPAPRRRVETMFRSREAWNLPRPEQGNEESYKGFLYIRCESCEKEKGYHAKFPQRYHRCDCEYRTDLRDMLPAFVRCKCGRNFKYMTNIQGRTFTMNCLGCGAPVDMMLNGKGTAYMPIADETR